MNETNKENIENTNESATTYDRSSADTLNDIGNGSAILSDGSNAEATGTAIGSIDGSLSDDWTIYDNQLSNSISDSNILSVTQGDAESLVQTETLSEQNLAQINSTLSSLNVTLTLIFAFLLFEWTEKKLKIVTDKFTDKRRHR